MFWSAATFMYIVIYFRFVFLTGHNQIDIILVKITWFMPYAMFWKAPLASSQSWVVIEELAQLKFIYYPRFGNKNICQAISKFGMTSKWRICCIWDSGQNSGISVPVPKDTIWYKDLNLLLEGCVLPFSHI